MPESYISLCDQPPATTGSGNSPMEGILWSRTCENFSAKPNWTGMVGLLKNYNLLCIIMKSSRRHRMQHIPHSVKKTFFGKQYNTIPISHSLWCLTSFADSGKGTGWTRQTPWPEQSQQGLEESAQIPHLQSQARAMLNSWVSVYVLLSSFCIW